MKTILSLIISVALVVSGYSQTRNVLVGTNNTVVQPTNFWSADASNARSGLGLGTAATNSASAFQPSSLMLSNLASSNGVNLTNIALSGVVGALATNGNATNLTNFPASLLRTNGSAAALTNFPTTPLNSNVSGVVAVVNGGSGATTASEARTNLGLGWSALTNTNAATSLLGISTNGQVVANTGTLSFTNAISVPALVLPRTVYNSNVVLGFYTTNTIPGVYTNVEVFGFAWANANSGRLSYYHKTSEVMVIDQELIRLREPVSFFDSAAAETTRTNLGLGWSALTNSNVGTSLVSVDTNGVVVSPTNFWQVAPIQTLVQDLTGITVSQTNNATNARNLYVYSLTTNVSSISNIIILPTNTSTFNGDELTVIHKGTTNTTTVVRQAGSTNNLITLSRFDESVKFIRELGQWDFYHNISFVEPIQFSGTNASANAAASRTNLGLGTTNNVTFGSLTLSDSSIRIGATNGLSVVFDYIGSPLFSVNIGGASFSVPVFFGASAATTRTNLGLGETNNVTFSALTLSSDLTLGSGDNIVLSTTNGTKIGTATNQLLGFYNQTPITQPSSTGLTNGFTGGGGGATVHPQSTFTGGIGTNAYTISDIVAHLKSLGLIAP